MSDPTSQPRDEVKNLGANPETPLTPEARRALEEARARREQAQNALPPEKGGPAGPEPTRYGDWERGGISVDF